MVKVIKAFSLDRRTVDILENYCKQAANSKKTISRSKVVNEAIFWFLSGDVAELVHSNEELLANFQRGMKEKDAPAAPAKSWWRQILGF